MRADSTRLRRVGRALERTARFQPLSADPSEIWLWQNHDLASLLENRLNLRKDPVALTDEDRANFGPRVTASSSGFRRDAPATDRAFWILDGARRRVGTVALADTRPRDAFLELSSLYVVPSAREQGWASLALSALHATALKSGFSGTRLATEWSWQRAVRFYLGRSMWVWGWRRAIEFILHRELPLFRVEVEGERASFILDADPSAPLFEARRANGQLEWRASEHPEGLVRALAPGTFALALASRGWPLVTDRAGIDALALELRRFEARDREHGWHVPSSSRPGLD
jgi:GNAT superfamily N-acetyltransferase